MDHSILIHSILIFFSRTSYKEQIEKVSRLKEDTIHAILKNSQEIAMFKQEVSRHLQDLRDFAEVE
jgi:kinetochore protein NDC80